MSSEPRPTTGPAEATPRFPPATVGAAAGSNGHAIAAPVATRDTLGAVLYAPDSDKSNVVLQFAQDLVRRGWLVRGFVIETVWDGEPAPGTRKTGLNLVDLPDSRRIPFARPDGDGLAVGRWLLDPAVLARADATLKATADAAADVDLVVVDKYGPLEGRGDGLSAGLSAVLASGRPALVTVRGEFLDDWDRFARESGRPDGGIPLRPSLASLWRWWGPERLTEELRRSVPDAGAKRVVLGRNWTLVEGPDGVGLAHSPGRDAPGCRPVAGAGAHAGRSLADLARLVDSWNPVETAIGWAAINAHVNAPARLSDRAVAQDRDGFAALAAAAAPPDRPMVTVGRFATDSAEGLAPQVIERVPRAGEWPEAAAAWLLPRAGRVLLTASALGNGSLPGLLRHCAGGLPRPVTALVGPSTPMAPALHAYGLDILSGFMVTDADRAARVVAEGGGVRDLARCGRKLSLLAPGLDG